MINLSQIVKQARLQAILNNIDIDSDYGFLKLYNGTMPTNVGPITTQTLLAELELSYPCADISGLSMTFRSITEDDLANATGTASWGRIFSNSLIEIIDLDAGNLASDAAIKLNNTNIYAGGIVRVNSAVIVEG